MSSSCIRSKDTMHGKGFTMVGARILFVNAVILATVFIRIVAAATINFSLAGVQLLIEGGFY